MYRVMVSVSGYCHGNEICLLLLSVNTVRN